MKQYEISVGGRNYLDPKDISHLSADVNYTQITFVTGKKIVVATTLKKLESRFQPFQKFFRISKSLMINLDCIQQIENEKVILQNGLSFRPSRRRKKAFFEFVRPLNNTE